MILIYSSFFFRFFIIIYPYFFHPTSIRSTMSVNEFDRATEAAEFLKSHYPPSFTTPKVAIICGTGLGGISNILESSSKVEVPYDKIPGFKQSTVQGHAGKLILGLIGSNKVPVICMVGRLHSYEGYDVKDTVFPVRVFTVLGVPTLIATNAAGGLNKGYKVGDVMILDDHINLPGFAGLHPLKGPNDERFGSRFVPLSDAYDLELRSLVFKAQQELNISRNVHEGTYAFVSGPTFESRAESRYLQAVGADAVGMSTVPEVVVARHGGMKVLALSLVTNEAVTAKPPSGKDIATAKAMDDGIASHEEVLEAGRLASLDVEKIIENVVNNL